MTARRHWALDEKKALRVAWVAGLPHKLICAKVCPDRTVKAVGDQLGRMGCKYRGGHNRKTSITVTMSALQKELIQTDAREAQVSLSEFVRTIWHKWRQEIKREARGQPQSKCAKGDNLGSPFGDRPHV